MRSSRIKEGINAAPQRALLGALGVTEREMENLLSESSVRTMRLFRDI